MTVRFDTFHHAGWQQVLFRSPTRARRPRKQLLGLRAAVGIDGFAYAFAQMVLITFMSTIVSKEMAASQFALLTSLCALPGSLLAGTSGYFIKYVGFVDFFIGTSLLGVPVALLAWYVFRRHGAPTWDARRRW